ncbi:PAAR-like domain-containing protein [Rhodobacter viridis]|uniref:PAAR-like domain-containing protein n=1 Tax=Rhodobacter viridis TaxID=1054202 RepID=UPI0015E8E558|nr:PAAR-like domain-containing protein [Rhodobacter viridis]
MRDDPHERAFVVETGAARLTVRADGTVRIDAAKIVQVAEGTTTVFADGGNSCANRGSEVSTSIGDEPGSGGGVKSGTNRDRATWLSWSADVFLGGQPACRLSDKMLLNNGNTAALGGLNQQCLSVDEIKDKLCDSACACKTVTLKQKCVAEKIEKDNYDGQYPKQDAQIWREVSFRKNGDGGFSMIMSQGGKGSVPTSNPMTPGGGIRPDCILRDGSGTVTRLVEMKCPRDTLRPTQALTRGSPYNRAAQGLGTDCDLLDVTECGCWDDPPPGALVPVTVPSPQKEPATDWGKVAKYTAVTAGAGLAIFACWASGVCEAAAAAAGAAAAGTAAVTLVTQ